MLFSFFMITNVNKNFNVNMLNPKLFLLVLIKLKYQPEEQEAGQDPYIYQIL